MAIARVTASSLTQGLPKRRTMLAGNSVILPGSYDAIATANGTGSSGTITFSSIPATYKHLQIRGIARTTASASTLDNIQGRFNSDTAGNYTGHYLYGNGSTVASASIGGSVTYMLAGRCTASSATTNVLGTVVIDILDYANTNKYKTLRSLSGWDNNGSGEVFFESGLWMNTGAINSVTLFTSSNWTTSTQFDLYGVK